MSAKHPEINLLPFLRRELSGREQARTASHLEGCTICRMQAETLARTMQIVAQQIKELPAPDWAAYRSELRRRCTAREARLSHSWQPIFVGGGLIAAGIAAVALVTLTAMNHRNQGAPTEPEMLALADAPDVGLLRNYPMVERMEMLQSDNYEIIEQLDQLAPPPPSHEIQHL
jgi:hypothetical protein